MEQHSLYEQYFNSLGHWGILLPLLVMILLALLPAVLYFGRGPWVGPTILAIVSLPCAICMYVFPESTVMSLSVVARSGVTPRISEISEGLRWCFMGTWFAMWITLPVYLLSIAGSVLRSLVPPRDEV